MASTIPTNGLRAVEPPARAGGHPTTPAGGRAGLDRTAPPVQVGPLGRLARRYWPAPVGVAVGVGLAGFASVAEVGSAVLGGAVVATVLAGGGLRWGGRR